MATAPPPASGCTSSWAARRRSWSSTTPTSRPRSTAPSPASLINAGQDCTAATRAYRAAAAVRRVRRTGVADLMAAVRLGPTDDPATDLGPLISVDHQDKVAGMVDRARGCAPRSSPAAQSRRRRPGPRLPTTSRRWSPTAARTREISATRCSARCWRSLPFDDDDEAIRLANDTPYGLAASAWTRDVLPRRRATREIRAGCVWVNDHIPIISEMPHGGYKAQSVSARTCRPTRSTSTPTSST